MSKYVFFSFHYERDAWRAAQVRNCNMLPSEDQIGFIDAADWESIKKKGDAAIERWIDDQLDGTSATAVLIGAETADREWVQDEIVKSWNRGNALIGIRIHNIKDSDKKTDVAGHNPFDDFKLPDGTLLSSVCKTYDWVLDNGRDNLGAWITKGVDIRASYGDDDEIVHVEKVQRVAASAVAGGFSPRAPWAPDDHRHGR